MVISRILILILFISISLHAAPIFYSNDLIDGRTAFELDAVNGFITESFEDYFSPGNIQSFNMNNQNKITFSVNDGNLYHDDFPRYITDGDYAIIFHEYPSTILTISFETPINYFGVDINDMNYGSMSFSDNIGNSATDILVGDQGSNEGGPGFQNLQFFGVTNTDAFSSVSLTFTNNSGSTGTIALDRFSYGLNSTANVPEPNIVALLSTSLLCLVLIRKHNYKKS